jgi:hypothetical protein
VRFVVDKVALGQVCFQILWFDPVNITSPWLAILISHLVATVQRQSHPSNVNSMNNVLKKLL